jgi:hypothetical protein
MELLLYRVFLEAGLPAPKMLIEVPVGHDREISRWVYDIFCSLLPRMRQHDLSSEAVGDLGSLESRLQAELTDMRTIGACIGLVGAWCQTPRSMQSAGANQ